MDTLNDTKLAALNFQNGKLSDHIDDAETLYLQNKTLDFFLFDINDLWDLEFDLTLIPAGQFNDIAGSCGSCDNISLWFIYKTNDMNFKISKVD